MAIVCVSAMRDSDVKSRRVNIATRTSYVAAGVNVRPERSSDWLGYNGVR